MKASIESRVGRQNLIFYDYLQNLPRGGNKEMHGVLVAFAESLPPELQQNNTVSSDDLTHSKRYHDLVRLMGFPQTQELDGFLRMTRNNNLLRDTEYPSPRFPRLILASAKLGLVTALKFSTVSPEKITLGEYPPIEIVQQLVDQTRENIGDHLFVGLLHNPAYPDLSAQAVRVRITDQNAGAERMLPVGSHAHQRLGYNRRQLEIYLNQIAATVVYPDKPVPKHLMPGDLYCLLESMYYDNEMIRGRGDSITGFNPTLRYVATLLSAICSRLPEDPEATLRQQILKGIKHTTTS